MKSKAAILPLVDLVFLALGAMLACMTQMELIHVLPIEVTRIGKGSSVMPQNEEFEVLTLTELGMTLSGEQITESDLPNRTANKRIVLRAYKGLPTQDTVRVIAKLAEAGAEVSVEVQETSSPEAQ
jgi:biopolymer transport protein ExbD